MMKAHSAHHRCVPVLSAVAETRKAKHMPSDESYGRDETVLSRRWRAVAALWQHDMQE
jgi:hypothetical protein